MKKRNKLKKIILTALFAALTCVATLVVQIPTGTNGYVNLGDCMVLLSGFMLGAVYGPIGAALGSAFADVIGGYYIFVPGTFVVKGLTSLTACLILKLMTRRSERYRLPGAAVGAVAGEVVMVAGYLIYESILPGISFVAAMTSIPGNALQGAAGVLVSVVLYSILNKTKLISKFGLD